MAAALAEASVPATTARCPVVKAMVGIIPSFPAIFTVPAQRNSLYKARFQPP